MEKTFVILMLTVMVAPFCRSQDTVQYMDPCYLFNEKHPYTVYPWPPRWGDSVYNAYFDTVNWGWDGLCSKPCGNNMEYYSYGYPRTNQQEPVMVYGVALTIVGWSSGSDFCLTESDMEKYPYDVIIGRLVNNKIVAIDSTTWNSSKDAIASFRYSILGDSVLYEHVVPVYEFYFDTPHLMTDTFYVGYRLTVPDTLMLDRRVNLVLAVDSVSTMDTAVNPFEYVYHPFVYNDNVHEHLIEPWFWGGEFPILQPNRHCSVPEAPEWLVYTTTNTVRFTLPYIEGDSLILSIAREGQPADSGTIYPVTGAVMDIVVPDSGRYSARLARICQRDIEVQSRWSAPANFFLLNSLAIGRGPGAAHAFDIYPNPASGTVAVDCEAREGTLEVVDLQGRTLLTAPATQRTLDISRLPSGSYFVRLTTPDGSAVRQLAVEN